NARIGGTKIESMRIAGEIAAIAREQMHLIAESTESKSIGIPRRVKVCFGEINVAFGREHPAGRDAELPGLSRIIREEPAPHIDRLVGRIVELDGIDGGGNAVRQDFVD